MKRISYLCVVAGIALLALTACEPKNPPQAPTPNVFPKKHLIEEFTGQGCGYCPYGMDAIHAFTANDTNWVTILHHYGYSPDKFSVSGCNTITRALGVSGAPNMCINRAKTTYKDEYNRTVSNVVFHPGYLETTARTQFADSTYASIEIQNTYDATSRELKVDLSGCVVKEDCPELMLTVLVKESGMIDVQADFYNTFEGWKEFRHTNAVRAYLTAPKGDTLAVNNKRYSASYSLILNSEWVPENCMVVAFISEAFQPVVQAGQAPVVAGSKGGADITHGGITPVPVPDYYPEINATNGPHDYSKNEVDTLTASYAYYKSMPEDGVKYWAIQAYSSAAAVSVNGTVCVPLAEIFFITDINASTDTVPTGTFELLNTYAPGTAEAGYRNDEEQTLGGSSFYYLNAAYFKQGSWYAYAQWLIADGTLTITKDGWSLTGHTRNGANIKLCGGKPQIKGQMSAPVRKALRKEQITE